ncbi:lactate/malate family dehydrogenase [Streptomyces roseoverticillatus]|uniref:Lactate/malate dehydrogenase N-terminal domain-containing protein n=1 Tax=Streptomyces roseoverticillatus TaxID=66429 RepID=A0ABV3IT57_9ACTN
MTAPLVGAVGVIGAGAVGQSVAMLLAAGGWCESVRIVSRTGLSAQALVTDLEDMCQVTASSVRAVHVTDAGQLVSCEAVVVCPRGDFTNTARTDIRMAGLNANAPVIVGLARKLAHYQGLVVMVTNPVDVLTRLFAEVSGCPRVYGVGSNTDTARYRLALAQVLRVPVEDVEGHVIGEHGDQAVVCASATRVNGRPVEVPVGQIHRELADRPARINAGLGRTRCGPAGAVIAALRAGLGLDDTVVELSVNHERRWMGIPLRFTAGRPTVCLPRLDAAEARQLVAADDKLRDAYEPLARLHVPVRPSWKEKTAVTRTATHIATAAQAVTVTSNTPVVTEWALRYFGPWWNAASTTADDGPQVIADVNPARVTEIAQHIADHAHDEAVYANSTMHIDRDDDGTVAASQPDDKLVYRAEPDGGPLRIYGCEDVPIALAAARLAREVVRGKLLADGWSILHASAVVRDGRTVLTLGDKGAGKTTTALLLARAGWQLLANDRVFIRREDNRLRVLPWPSAAAIGLGLLDALDWYDQVRERVQRGEQLHPTQHQKVTDALHSGSRTPLWNESGKELKPQFFPDQLHSWLGLTLVTEGHAARILFPKITPGTEPALLDEDRSVGADDFFTAGTEDRYPDVFGLLPADLPGTQPLLELLGDLPRNVLALGHDVKANTDFLAQVTGPTA